MAKFFLKFLAFSKDAGKELCDKSIRDKLNVEDPKMSAIYRILMENSTIRKEFLMWMNMDPGLELPQKGGTILFGTLSEAIHDPMLRTVVVASDDDVLYKKFFEALARRFKVKMIEYDAELSALEKEPFDDSK